MNKDYERLVKSVPNENMNKLQDEVFKFESLGYKIKSVTGYGECVFTVNVKMINIYFSDVHLTIPQSEDDSTIGRVMFNPIGKWDVFTNYQF